MCCVAFVKLMTYECERDVLRQKAVCATNRIRLDILLIALLRFIVYPKENIGKKSMGNHLRKQKKWVHLSCCNKYLCFFPSDVFF